MLCMQKNIGAKLNYHKWMFYKCKCKLLPRKTTALHWNE